MKLTPADICLAMIANPPEEQFIATLNSVRRYVSSAVIVVAPDSPLLKLESRLGWFPNLHFVKRELDHSSQHRNYALARAEVYAPWVLLVDRGDTIEGELPEIDDDATAVCMPIIENHGKGSLPLQSIKLVKADHWRYMGRIHEALLPVSSEAGLKAVFAPNLVYHSAPSETTTSDNYERVLRLLKEDLAEAQQTNNAALGMRALFYLARTYHARNEFGSALETYMQRLRLHSSGDEETFWCVLGCARCAASMGMSFDSVESLFLQVATHFPQRAEPLKDLAVIYQNRAKWCRERMARMPLPNGTMLWVETDAYGSAQEDNRHIFSKLNIKLDS